MAELPGCALCRRRADGLVTVFKQAFCVTCLTAVGRFVCVGPPGVVEGLWRARPHELARRALADIVNDEILKIRALSPSDPDLEAKISSFKAAFTQQRSPDVLEPSLAENNLQLAIAYREMGLSDDALEKAALALCGAGLLGSGAQVAAELVLGEGALRHSLDETLARLREALFPG